MGIFGFGSKGDDPKSLGIKVLKGVTFDELKKDTRLNWILKAKMKDAEITVKNGKILWNNGTWISGDWKDGFFVGGTWKGGTWFDGTFEGGTWEKGTWKDGVFNAGIWKDGTWMNGEWEGGTWQKGTWKQGKIQGDRSSKPPVSGGDGRTGRQFGETRSKRLLASLQK